MKAGRGRVSPVDQAQVAEVVRLCDRYEVPLVARGAGTSLAGGCLPPGAREVQTTSPGGVQPAAACSLTPR